MNRNDFLNMIEDTVSLDRHMIGEVYELIDIFPYFQSAHLLLLKGLYNNADVKFENQLRNSAIHIGDREVLYWLLKTKTSSESEKTEGKKIIELKQEIVSDTQQTVIESAKNSEHMINEIEKDSEEPDPDEDPDTAGQARGHSIMIATEPDNTESAGVMLLLENETSPSDDKVFFMDPGFSIPERSDLLELDLDEDSSIISQNEEKSPEILELSEKTSKKLVQSELIDKFIITNPRIDPQKDKALVPMMISPGRLLKNPVVWLPKLLLKFI